jgi:hypothetical protein
VRLVGAALLLITALSSASACSNEAKPPGKSVRPAKLVTQGPDTGDLLAHGTVLVDGKPVDGARVRAVLSPEGEAAENLKVGERVPTWETDPVTTGDDGTWAVSIDPDSVPSTYFPAGQESLNFELEVQTRTRVAMWWLTASLVKPIQVWRSDEEARPGDAVLEIALDLGAKTITLTDSHGKRQRASLVVMGIDG